MTEDFRVVLPSRTNILGLNLRYRKVSGIEDDNVP